MVRIRRRLQDRCYKHHHKHLGFPLAQKLLPISDAPQTTSYHQLPEIKSFSIMQNPTSKDENLEKLRVQFNSASNPKSIIFRRIYAITMNQIKLNGKK